jgi:RNA recognition motif
MGQHARPAACAQARRHGRTADLRRKFDGLPSNPVVSGLARIFSVCLPWRHAPPPGALFGQRLPPSQSSANQEAECIRLSIPIYFREYSAVTKLYVGNLPFTATEDAVRALFSKHGTVEQVSLINDRDTGRPRGFGFVEMSNADASRAMQALNGADFDGRSLKVNEAQERERSGGGNRGGGSRRY